MKEFILLIILVNSTLSTFCQKDSYFKRVFVDAEYYLLYEEYKDALPLYMEILKSYPANANIHYRVGLCYLNLQGEKAKSLPYLEKATSSITDKYKEGYFTETRAPREAFLAYGRALRITGNIAKSLQAFTTYKSMLSPDDKQAGLIADKEMESVEYAKIMLEKPRNHKIVPVGRNISTRFPEINPLSNSKGDVLIFTSIQRFYNAILLSEKQPDFWSNPISLNSQLLADGPIRTVGISSNGNILILARNDNDDYNLYYSQFDKAKKTWAPIAKFPKEINTRSWETFGSLSSKGDTLYYSSNKEGGYGGFDLYYSVKQLAGEWSQPINMGATINTPFDETSPFITENGGRLYFCSKGHTTMGGYDIVVSFRDQSGWGKPINVGYPLNTTDDDTFFFPIGDGNSGYISRVANDTQGEEDIYFVTLDL